MNGAMVQMPKMLKKRVARTQKKSWSRRGANAATTWGTLAALATAVTRATAPTPATRSHQSENGVNNMNSRAINAAANEAPATMIGVGIEPRIAERTRW